MFVIIKNQDKLDGRGDQRENMTRPEIDGERRGASCNRGLKVARGSARAGRDCVAFLVSLAPDRAASFSLDLSLPPPLTTRPLLQADSYLFDVRLLFASPSLLTTMERTAPTASARPRLRLVLLLLYLADLQWRGHSRFSR